MANAFRLVAPFSAKTVLAPASNNMAQISVWPNRAPMCSGVWPTGLLRTSTLAPADNNWCTIRTWPALVATCSGVFSDVFAVGIVAYQMVCGDADAYPWADNVERTAETMRPLPEGRCSPELKTLIEDGLLNPVFVSTQSCSNF